METAILTVMKFRLSVATPWDFSRRFMCAAQLDKRSEHLVDYMLELFLQEPAYLHYLPSIIAASAIFLALYTLHYRPWNDTLAHVTGLKVEDLQHCVRALHATFLKACANPVNGNNQVQLPINNQKAVKDKYSTDKMMQVAKIKARNL